MLIFPMFTTMMQDSGVPNFSIAMLIVAWSSTSFLLQVPSGAIADKYSRKNILIAAQFSKIAAFAVWMLFPDFTGFLIGFVFWGAQGAFMSGTFEALLYDEAQRHGEVDKYSKIYGRMRAADFVGLIAASALAAPVFAIGGYNLVLLATIIMIIASIISLFGLKNIKNKESTHETQYFELLKHGAKIIINSPRLFRLIIFLALTMALSAPIMDYYGIFLRNSGVETKHIGYFAAFAWGVDAVGALIAHRYKSYKNSIFYILFTICGILLFISGTLTSLLGIAFLILFGFLNRIIKTVFEAKLQDEIPDGIRATVSSVYMFFMEIGIITLTLSFGYIAEDGKVQTGFQFIALTTIGLGVMYWIQRIIRTRVLHIKEQRLTKEALQKQGEQEDNIPIEFHNPPDQQAI